MRKFAACDVLAVLGEIVSRQTQCHQNDFDIDIKMFEKAVDSSNPRERRLLWLLHSNGTICVSEYDAFLKNTYAHTRWTAYGGLPQDSVIASYAVEIKERRGKAVYGDLYEIEYPAHRRKIMDAALPISSMEITFKNGDKRAVPYNYDFYHYVNNKNVLSIQYLPSDLKAWENLLKDEQNERKTARCYPWNLEKLRLEYDCKPTYSIYQLKSSEHDLLFENYDCLCRQGLSPNISRYDLAYIAEAHNDYGLDEIYDLFNSNRPEDFTGHSLSVSDVIVTFNGKRRLAYYVASFGFQPLPHFFDNAANYEKEWEL